MVRVVDDAWEELAKSESCSILIAVAQDMLRRKSMTLLSYGPVLICLLDIS
jgi:hypothetical protein